LRSFSIRGPGTFQAHDIPMRILIQDAYRVRDFQVVGAPDWFNEETYSIDARIPVASNDVATVRLMLQDLLEERFHLRIHRETRQLPTYTLGIAKGGPKLPPSKCGEPAPQQKDSVASRALPTPCGDLRIHTTGLNTAFGGFGVSISDLVFSIGYVSKRLVTDHTGITQRFDLDIEFARDGVNATADDNPSASLATALKDSLGLKLDYQRGPVEILVIDHAERPSGN
jgi:uncharacterized protein (TIGR03435 family)